MLKARSSRGVIMNVLLERFPYRYVENCTLENGKPDFRIQKMDKYSPRWKDMYLCDNGMPVSYTHLTLPTSDLV